MSEGRSTTIPNRWLYCPKMSENIIGNQFLAFKTPLSCNYNKALLVEQNYFTPTMVFNHMKAIKKKMTLWIDLTNTSRFYDKEEVIKHGCQYKKIKLRGHKESPSEEQTKEFINIVVQSVEKDPEGIIGVHCTHGFNRTGFLIIAYLVMECNCTLSTAIHEFSKNRPPGIYKQDYLNDLYTRYGYDEIDSVIEAPLRPKWCMDEDGEEEVVEEGDANGGNDGHRPKHKFKKYMKKKAFMPEVNGVTFVEDPSTIEKVHNKVKAFCKCDNYEFPGSQPVSMNKENIKKLNEFKYRVSWKADGVRYMMLIDGPDDIYLLDRDNCVFKVVGLKFFHNKTNKPLDNTLLDGEMVIDEVRGVKKVRYLCYDVVRFEKMRVDKAPFYPTRINCIDQEIIKPRDRAIASGVIRKEDEPFRIGLKHFWDVTMAQQLLEDKFIKTLTHEPDGLIFQPSEEPYMTGTCPNVLKWKPSYMNSIDFLLKIEKDTRPGMLQIKRGILFVGQGTYFANMKYTKDIKNLHGKIIECKFENGEWVFMRERTDKSFPNSLKTAEAVFESIKNPVTKEMLLEYTKRGIILNDSPPSKRPRTAV